MRSGYDFSHLARQAVEHIKILPKHLNRQITPGAGQHFGHTHINWLGKPVIDAFELLQHHPYGIFQFGFFCLIQSIQDISILSNGHGNSAIFG